MMKMQVLNSKLHFEEVLMTFRYSYSQEVRLFTRDLWIRNGASKYIFKISEMLSGKKVVQPNEIKFQHNIEGEPRKINLSSEDLLADDWMEICFSSHDDDSMTLTEKLTAEEVNPTPLYEFGSGEPI